MASSALGPRQNIRSRWSGLSAALTKMQRAEKSGVSLYLTGFDP